MDMNLEQLASFVEVARLGNFTRAAEHLHLAQPSLSRQITSLEQDLGAQLVHRARSGSSLTIAGESLLPLARRMLADADTVRRELDELAGLRRGRVRLGATPTLCISLVAEVLSAFHSAHPAIELHLSEHGSRRLLDELSAGQLDLAIVTTSDVASAERATLTPLLVEELVVISAAASAPVSASGSISLDDVGRLPQIVFSSSYDLRGATDAAFRAAGVVPEVVLEGAEMDAVLRFVERGLGVAIVPAMVLIDRPGLRGTRLRGSTSPGSAVPDPAVPDPAVPDVAVLDSTLTRTISLARPNDVAPTAAVSVMQRTIADTASVLAERAGATMRTVTDRAVHAVPGSHLL